MFGTVCVAARCATLSCAGATLRYGAPAALVHADAAGAARALEEHGVAVFTVPRRGGVRGDARRRVDDRRGAHARARDARAARRARDLPSRCCRRTAGCTSTGGGRTRSTSGMCARTRASPTSSRRRTAARATTSRHRNDEPAHVARAADHVRTRKVEQHVVLLPLGLVDRHHARGLINGLVQQPLDRAPRSLSRRKFAHTRSRGFARVRSRRTPSRAAAHPLLPLSRVPHVVSRVCARAALTLAPCARSCAALSLLRCMLALAPTLARVTPPRRHRRLFTVPSHACAREPEGRGLVFPLCVCPAPRLPPRAPCAAAQFLRLFVAEQASANASPIRSRLARAHSPKLVHSRSFTRVCSCSLAQRSLARSRSARIRATR